jgi:hypothetical protein
VSHRAVLVLSALLLAGSTFADKPIATLSSPGPVVVSGTPMSAATVAFWPVANHDEIATLDYSAVLILPDNSRITLNQNSKARVATDGGRLRFQLLSGSADYNLVTPSSAVLMVGDKLMFDRLQGNLGPKTGSNSDGSRRGSPGSPITTPVTPPTHPSPIY